MAKNFAIRADQIKPLTNRPGGGIASDRITVDGRPVCFMYREASTDRYDSGWRFFAGDEDDDYASEPSNFEVYALNTIANYSPDIVPLLTASLGSAFLRNPQARGRSARRS